MIRVFEPNETNFNHNETIIKSYYCEVEEKANGLYELTLETSLADKEKLKEWYIIQAPTPRGLQLFRIYKPFKNLDTTTIHARHIFYDLNNYFLENIRPTNMNTAQVITHILNGTNDKHRFIGTSNLNRIYTANYVRKSPVEAIMSGDNGVLNRWGGFLVRDNFKINIIAEGNDNGYRIEYGKNLKGIEVEVELEDVVTRVLPTWVDESNTVQYLPEKYIESPLIKNYPFPITKELRLNLNEDLKDLELKDLYEYYRNYVKEQFEKGLDKPKINIKVDFVELSKTEEYKDFKFLEIVEIYDLVKVKVDKLDIDLEANIISTVYDCLEEKYIKLEIGNFKTDLATAQKEFIQLQETINSEDFLSNAIDNATSLITGNNGGYVVMKTDANKQPYEILIMDTNDIRTAKKVWRWNKNGLGFSSTGYNGTYGTAITNDGRIVADFITAGILNGNVLRTGAIEGGRVSWNLDTGALNIDGDIVYNPSTRRTTIRSNLITLDGNTDVRGTFNVSGNMVVGGTISASNLQTKDFESNQWGDTTLKGNSLNVGSNSSYVTIKDTGGRGQVDINGTVAAKGSNYNIEMQSGGLYMSGSKIYGGQGYIILRPNSTIDALYCTNSEMYIFGKKLIFNSDGTVKWN